MVAASNYYTILNDRPTILKDEFSIINDGNIPEIWSALTSEFETKTKATNWRITVDDLTRPTEPEPQLYEPTPEPDVETEPEQESESEPVVIEKNKEKAEFHLHKGQAYGQFGRWTEASYHFNKALEFGHPEKIVQDAKNIAWDNSAPLRTLEENPNSPYAVSYTHLTLPTKA